VIFATPVALPGVQEFSSEVVGGSTNVYADDTLYASLVQNADRHNENLGFLRNKRSGRIISLAPNFDNNVALISRTDVLNEDREHFGMCNSFVKFLKSNELAMKLFDEIEFPSINDEILEHCFDFEHIHINKENIKKFILNGIKYIKNIS